MNSQPNVHFPLLRQLGWPDAAPTERRYSSQPAGDESNWWMITLSDLTLLILGFTVAWYVAGGAAVTPGADSAKINPAVAIQSRGAPLQKAPDGSVPWQDLRRQMESFVVGAKLSGDVTVEAAPQEIILSLRDAVPFASGKADLRAQAFPLLEKIAGIVLANSSLSVEISGHTDSRRIATAEFPSNWELSAARASRVARYLVERGVHPRRIAVQGYADLRPRSSNATTVARRANRRVEVRLFHDAGVREKIPPTTAAR
jgi:chemotaxis protein MotB